MKAGKPLFSLSDEQFALLLIIPLLIFSISIVAYPILYSLWLSLNEINFVLKEFRFVGLENYIAVFADPKTLHYVKTTLIFTADVTVFVLLVGLGIALLLNESFKGRSIVRAILLIPWAVSEYCTAVVWQYLYAEHLGFFNAVLMLLGIINPGHPIIFLTPDLAIHFTAIAYSWHFTPLIAFFLLAGLQTVPEDLYRQARVDGAGPVRRFRNVMLPHLRYAVLISLVLATMEAARATDIIILLTGGGPGIATQTLTWTTYRVSFRDLAFGLGAAYSYFLLALVIVITLVYFLILTRRRR